MTSTEVRNQINNFLGKQIDLNVGTEYEYVIGFHARPGEMICVIKNNGSVMWENDLPERLVPNGPGKPYFLI